MNFPSLSTTTYHLSSLKWLSIFQLFIGDDPGQCESTLKERLTHTGDPNLISQLRQVSSNGVATVAGACGDS